MEITNIFTTFASTNIKFINMSVLLQEIQVQSVYKPKRKPNIARWMTKHKVSSSVTSVNFGTHRAIESLQQAYEHTKMIEDENRN